MGQAADTKKGARPLFWLWAPVVLYGGLIFYWSSQPIEEELLPLPDLDKVIHVIEYGILASLLMRALAGTRSWRSRWALGALAVALSSVYGVTDEWHQAFVPLRHPSAVDLAFDTLGSYLGQHWWWRWRAE